MIPLWSFIVSLIFFVGILLFQLRANKKIRTLHSDTSFILGCYIVEFGLLNETRINKIANIIEESNTIQ